ncbi:unnamed protein product [Clonostachys rhizophaga]|uniref:Uncharacterized protein n=1 Tax=Clonostachys rhizophaga TaxID=160324 RepID=A0A9N9VKD1_9HYPO|nr:unnamed protein product [Clonostachys rhizophaga]
MPAFVCSEQNCGLAFRRREHLIRHERRHTNSKPFSCSQCSRSFSRRSDGELALLIHLGSDVLKRHILHHSKHTPLSRAASACDFCHRRKVKCDGQEECARCREANRVCRRTRRILNSDPFPHESLPTDAEITIRCSNADTDNRVVTSLLAYPYHSPRNRSEGIDDARSNLNLPQPEQHPRENPKQDVTEPENNQSMERYTARENHAGSSFSISDLLSIDGFGSSLQETSFMGLHKLTSPTIHETRSMNDFSQRLNLENTSPVHPSSEGRSEVDRGSERDEVNFPEPSSGHVLPDTQTVNFQQERNIGPPDTTGGRRASVQAANDGHDGANNDALALLGLSQSSAPGPNIFQSWEESLQASFAQSPNTNSSASGHRRQSEASYDIDELTALHHKSRTQLDFHSSRGETVWESMSVGTPGNHSTASFPIPAELGHASATILEKRMIDRYFSSFHNHWPILHKASFSLSQCTSELQHAVGLIGGLLEGDPDSRAPSIRLHKWLSQRVLLQAIEVSLRLTPPITWSNL